MNTELQKIQSVANELTQQGYQVIIEPSKESLPFDLGNYKPDLIAQKGNQGVILAIKARKRYSIDRLQQVAENIATHAGWQFLLITPEDVTEDIAVKKDFPTWQELQTRLEKVAQLIEQNLLEPALVYLWGAIEVMLRKRAIQQNLPIDRFPINHLLNHSYSSGEISMHTFDIFKANLEKRNKVAHGLVTDLHEYELKEVFVIAKDLLKKWQAKCN